MADISVKVLQKASSYDLATLDEIKMIMGIPLTNTSQDEMLKVWITAYSDMIATECRRVFGYETVEETWRGDSKPFDTDNGRIFLTRYPVADADIQSVTGPDGSDISLGYELENASGKIQFFNTSWSEPIRITYAGGYKLPDEAPPALKQALGLLVQFASIWQTRALASGVRMVSHKESRVMYFDFFSTISKTGGGVGPVGVVASLVKPLLMAYTRFYV